MHDTMESLYKVIGMDVLPDEYLPDDYTGPSAGPIQQIIRKCSCSISQVFAFRRGSLGYHSLMHSFSVGLIESCIAADFFVCRVS